MARARRVVRWRPLPAVGPRLARPKWRVLKSTDVAAWRPTLDALSQGDAQPTPSPSTTSGATAPRPSACWARSRARPDARGPGAPGRPGARQTSCPTPPSSTGIVQDPVAPRRARDRGGGGLLRPRSRTSSRPSAWSSPRGSRIGSSMSERRPHGAGGAEGGAVVRVNVVTRPVTSEKDVPSVLRVAPEGRRRGGRDLDPRRSRSPRRRDPSFPPRGDPEGRKARLQLLPRPRRGRRAGQRRSRPRRGGRAARATS